MLDRYMFGHVSRVSPEAPVPVVDIENEQVRLGGAANVGHNIHGLGATPIMLGVVGDDSSGAMLKGIFADLGFPIEGVIAEAERPTTIKTRVISGSQHMLRIDHETKQDISKSTEDRILATLERETAHLDAVILEDYNKGVITRSLITRVLALCNTKNIPVLVDPKFQNFFEYKNSTVFKPNKKEVEDALGMRLQNDEDVRNAGLKLLDVLKSEYVLLTLGEKGMLLFTKNDAEPLGIPTRARKVADVSGAGDTVIATLAVSMACGLTVHEAAIVANRAAGLVIEELGIVPIYQEQLVSAMLEDLAAESA
jgi:rfaE bifunctional protein kinase chain/domain